MRKVLIGLAAVVVLIVGALFALPMFIPSETVRAELVARLEEATGRDVRIDGPIDISVLPTASLSAGGVGIAGLTGEGEAFAVDSVSFGLSLLPLIGGNVEINALTIERPRILYEVDETGVSNWDGPPPANAAESIEDLIATEPEAAEATAEVVTGLDKLSIGRVTIVDGTFTYRDRASGIEETADAINLVVDMPRITGPGSVEGTFRYLGVENKIALDIGEREHAERFERIPVGLTLSTDGGSAGFDGVAFDGGNLFAGTFKAEGESLRRFLAAFTMLPDAPGFGAFALEGKLVATDSDFLAETFAGTIGDVPVSGGMRAAFDRSRPGFGMKLVAGRIDLARFEAATEGTSTDEAIDLSFLGLFDANVDFSAEEIVSADMLLRNLGLDLKLAGSVLEAGIRSVEVNGAPGSGTLVLDARDAEPAVSGTVKMSGLDLAGLMALAGQTAPATGTVALDVTFSTRGATGAALAANLEAGGAVSLGDGRVTGLQLADLVGGDKAADSLEDIDVTAAFASLASPVELKGNVSWRGTRFAIAAKADGRALLAGSDVPVAFNASSDRVNFGFNGSAGLAGLGAGKVSLSTSSLRDLLAWIGQPMEAGRGLKAFSIDGDVRLAADSFSFEKASFTLDKSSGVGTGTLAFGGKPRLTAGLAMEVLDLSPYLAAPKGSGAEGGGDAPIDFSGLRALDADLNLKADSILANSIKIGPSALTAKIVGGRLDANLAEMALYSGTGTGAIAVDGASKTPAVSASFRLNGVDTLAFLTDALGFKRLEGTGTFAFDLQASGNTQSALTSSLAGNGHLAVKNGAIRGINIPKMLQTLSVQSLLGWQPSNDRTEFTDVGATFTIDKGIVTNNDLTVAGPEFQLAGAGTIDLPAETINYRLTAKVANKNGKLQDFAAPVFIQGPLAKPKIFPDVQAVLLQNPEGALDQIENIGGDLFGLGGDKDQGGGKKKQQDTSQNDKGGKKKNKKNQDPSTQGVEDLLNTIIGQ
ncbi:MAG TPA: AsmA family protein [Bauldia sp.]|nr:AsmA family protein [Bauldia sp.]